MILLSDFLYSLTTNPWKVNLALYSLLCLVLASFILIVTPSSYNSSWIAPGFMGINCLVSFLGVLTTYQGDSISHSYGWFLAPNILLPLDIYIDALTAIIWLMTTFLSLLVFIYSVSYITPESIKKPYWCLMHFFIGAMFVLIINNNLIGIWLGWELMSIASYLLIGFWYKDLTSIAASARVWLVGNLGSICLLAGFILLGHSCKTFRLSELIHIPRDILIATPQVSLASVFIVLGILIKAAQFPLFHWLVTAITAPMPASALLHGATLVNASIYILLRIGPILPTQLLTILAFIGSITALTGAYAALTQKNLKRLLAYSTISQLGYTIMAIGIQIPATALIYMLTHALAKTCLFLCLGMVTFSMRKNPQPIYQDATDKHRSDLGSWMPIVGIAYLAASLALLGLPGFMGVFAKEKLLVTGIRWAILRAPITYYLSYLVPACSLVSATLTLVYVARSWSMIFTGTRLLNPITAYAKQSRNLMPLPMQVSILCLSLCCCSIPYQWLARSPSFQKLLHSCSMLLPEQNYPFLQANAYLLVYTPSIALLLGVFILYILKRTPQSAVNNRLMACLYKLSYHGWYLELINNKIARYYLLSSYLIAKIEHYVMQGLLGYLVSSYILLSQGMAWLDQKLIGGSIKVMLTIVHSLSKAYENLQKGHVQHYFWWTFIGIILIAIFLLVYNL